MSDSKGTATVADDDDPSTPTPEGAPVFNVLDVTVGEGEVLLNVTVTLSNAVVQPASGRLPPCPGPTPAGWTTAACPFT